MLRGVANAALDGHVHGVFPMWEQCWELPKRWLQYHCGLSQESSCFISLKDANIPTGGSVRDVAILAYSDAFGRSVHVLDLPTSNPNTEECFQVPRGTCDRRRLHDSLAPFSRLSRNMFPVVARGCLDPIKSPKSSRCKSPESHNLRYQDWCVRHRV